MWVKTLECKSYTVDRIEDEVAVCESENGEMVNIPLSLISGKVTDGCTVTQNGDGYTVHENKNTSNRELFDKLFKKGH